MERLAPVAIEPDFVLDLGSGLGETSLALAKRWRPARVVAVDLSRQMLKAARKRRSRFARIRELQADPARLPFASGSIDAAVANLSLPWVADAPGCLAEIARTLRPEGLLAFATLGPDTLSAVRDAWREVDDLPHVLAFADMHDIGDTLIRTGFSDPVLDVERLTVTYTEPAALYRDLSAAGARNVLAGRQRGLTGRGRFAAFEGALGRRFRAGRLAIDVELVFGHAFRSAAVDSDGTVRIEPTAIGRRRRR